MNVLAILQYPDERLRHVASRIAQVDNEIRQLASDLLATTYANNAVGLAATQVDVSKQIIVMDVSNQRDMPMVFINPEIVDHRGREKFSEGCLSLPGCWAEVERHAWIKVKALNTQGEEFYTTAEGLLSNCLQHEMDHLQGKLFIDYLSTFKRGRIIKQLQKFNKMCL